jgi:hypothetical protein
MANIINITNITPATASIVLARTPEQLQHIELAYVLTAKTVMLRADREAGLVINTTEELIAYVQQKVITVLKSVQDFDILVDGKQLFVAFYCTAKNANLEKCKHDMGARIKALKLSENEEEKKIGLHREKLYRKAEVLFFKTYNALKATIKKNVAKRPTTQKQQHAALETKLAKADTALELMTQKLAEATQAIATLTQQVKQLENIKIENDVLKEENEKLTEENTALKEELAALKASNEEQTYNKIVAAMKAEDKEAAQEMFFAMITARHDRHV